MTTADRLARRRKRNYARQLAGLPPIMPEHARARLHRAVVKQFGRGMIVTLFAPETTFNPRINAI
jgi:hypothetical protein